MLMFGCMCGLVASPVLGENTVEVTDSASPLLVLLAASDESAIKIERQLVGELRLTLDGVQVEQIAIERSDFLSVTLPEQLAVVQPLIRRFMARAAVWVVTGGRSGHLIQFVVSDRGNSTVRTVDAGSPEELALAVRELLDSAYLFNKRTKEDESIGEVFLFALGTSLCIGGGMVGHMGASLTGGAGLQGRFMLNDGVVLGMQVTGKLGPGNRQADGMTIGWRTEMGVFTGYLFRIGTFGIGPYGELAAHRNVLSSILGDGDYDEIDWWSFRGALGVELTLRLSGRLTMFVDWTVGGMVKSREFVRSSNSDSTVLKTPIMDYAFSLGFVTSLL
jgi:hypothetical protein